MRPRIFMIGQSFLGLVPTVFLHRTTFLHNWQLATPQVLRNPSSSRFASLSPLFWGEKFKSDFDVTNFDISRAKKQFVICNL